MAKTLRLAVAGLGRIGALHAEHAKQLEAEGQCVLVAAAEPDEGRRAAASKMLGPKVLMFRNADELAASKLADVTFIATPTDQHRANAAALIRAGQRVLLEKPLTGSLPEDREFCNELDERYPHSLMLAFQRRFDEPLQTAKAMIDEGAIGRVFKIVSTLEDSNPAPDGYVSGGILPDMSVHNVDEILWLTGQMPVAAAAIGNRLFTWGMSTAVEDFDDALLYLWFEGKLAAQVQVTRNHVSGYRGETWVFGEKGQVRIGRFDQDPHNVIVEAYGRSHAILKKSFAMKPYPPTAPEFFDRFGAAYKAELSVFLDCCRRGVPFPVTHRDGLRAMEVIEAGMKGLISAGQRLSAAQA